MTVQEIRMASIDVARLHSNKILDKLIRRLHGSLKEIDDNLVELLLELRIASEELGRLIPIRKKERMISGLPVSARAGSKSGQAHRRPSSHT